MKKTLIILLTSFLAMQINAQLVQVSGYLWTRGDSTVSVPYANIINKRTLKGMQSTFEGYYTILMGPGDTVEVSAIGYKNVTIALPKGYSSSYYHKNVYLYPKTELLGLVNISDWSWDKFKEAFASIPVPVEVEWVTLNPDLVKNSAPVRSELGYTVNGPLTWLYNKLGRKAKEQRKLESLKDGDDYMIAGSSRISTQEVMDLTGLPENEVHAFIVFCDNDPAFWANATEYDIQNKILQCLPEYKKAHPRDTPSPTLDSLKTDSL